MMNYEDATAFLHGRINYERVRPETCHAEDFKLDRMRRLLAKLNNPQQQLPAIHIAGTKGKGSTATMTAAVLMHEGYRVGLFTSPHVHSFEERFTVNNQLPTTGQVAELTTRVARAVQELEAESDSCTPTYFETLTAIAWLHFLGEAVDIVVLEVGLGGRLDATNICRPIVCCITSISRDHTHLLGETLPEIAREKGGIIKPGVPIVIGRMPPAPRDTLLKLAAQANSPTVLMDRDITVTPSDATGEAIATEVTVGGHTLSALKSGLPGAHQQANLAVAVAILDLIRHQGAFAFSDQQIVDGISEARMPLRCEFLETHPRYLLDGAHNWASVKALAELLRAEPASRRVLIFSASQDKDAIGMLRLLLPCVNSLVVPAAESRIRNMPAETLCDAAQSLGFTAIHAVDGVTAAVQQANQLATAHGLVCATGSFFLAAAVRELLHAPVNSLRQNLRPG